LGGILTAAAEPSFNDARRILSREETMMSWLKCTALTLAAGLVLLTMPGCEKKEGPAEKFGKKIDEAAEDAGDAIQDAGKKMEDAAKGQKK
jgi:hypothetical protein